MMEYLLKVNVALAACMLCYLLFLRKDTFFNWRRFSLLGFMTVTPVLPWLTLPTGTAPRISAAEDYLTVRLPEVLLNADQHPVAEASFTPVQVIYLIYIGVTTLLLLRLMAQCFGLIRLLHRCPTACIAGTRVRLLPDVQGPFSFFRWIFLPQTLSGTPMAEEILAHELAHVRQRHSIDVMAGELMCAFCWFNPFAWILKREMHTNLEHLADASVLDQGYAPKTYQYHLLALSFPKAAATIYNNFNVLPLKKRIQMMNKQRTRQGWKLKYLLFIPLAALLGTACTNETEQTTAPEASQEKATEQSLSISIATDSTATKKEQVYDIVEQMPEYPGGIPAMMEFIKDNIKYPESLKESAIQGRVVVQFVISETGEIGDVKVIRSIDPALDAEAVRVVKSMPRWKPGVQDGKTISVKYTMPVMFRL